MEEDGVEALEAAPPQPAWQAAVPSPLPGRRWEAASRPAVEAAREPAAGPVASSPCRVRWPRRVARLRDAAAHFRDDRRQF